MHEKYDLKNILLLSLNLMVKNLDLYKNILCKVLEFEIIYECSNHIILNNKELSKDIFISIEENSNSNIETVKLDDDNVLAFYLENEMIYSNICSLLVRNGIPAVKSFNPYWDENGKTFLISDDENFRIVFCRKKYKSLTNGLDYNARISMPTNSLDTVKETLINKYGMKKISFFSRQDNYDGIMLTPNELLDCHIEFTQYFGKDHKLNDSLCYSLNFINENSFNNYLSFDIVTSIDFKMYENKIPDFYTWIVDYIRNKF